MVTARDTQIAEFKRQIDQLKERVAQLSSSTDIDTNAQKEEMRRELETLKQKVLEELK